MVTAYRHRTKMYLHGTPRHFKTTIELPCQENHSYFVLSGVAVYEQFESLPRGLIRFHSFTKLQPFIYAFTCHPSRVNLSHFKKSLVVCNHVNIFKRLWRVFYENPFPMTSSIWLFSHIARLSHLLYNMWGRKCATWNKDRSNRLHLILVK